MTTIKPLEWRSEPPYSVARPMPTLHYATEVVWREGRRSPDGTVLTGSTIGTKTFPTSADAKAAAQADYEARISSCLAASPHPIVAEGVLDRLGDNCWSLLCKDYPTGGDDADTGYEVISYWEAEPRERTEGFGRTPIAALQDAGLIATLEAPAVEPGGALTRYRHVATRGIYEVIGIGKMQADGWFSDVDWSKGSGSEVDMREVVLYRNAEHGTLWVRPRTEFESGRFEVIP